MSEPFLAEIRIVGFNFAPRGWAFCDGQILPINQNQSLYSLLGTTYGGDGRTTFALPDLRDRVHMHPDAETQRGSDYSSTGIDSTSVNTLDSLDVDRDLSSSLTGLEAASSGGELPVLGLYHVIALQGLFPSRG
jgi:microcystin-dependent protein